MLGVVELTAAAMNILAPYLPKAAEGFASAVGKGAFEGAMTLLTSLPSLFRGDEQAAQVLSDFETNPDLHRQDLVLLLKAKISADPEFARELEKLVDKARRVVIVKQDAESVDSLTGVRKARVTKGDLSVDQKAKDVGQVTGIDDIEL